ncbi:MAG TPA: hypothetical protein VFK57_08955 [Vicinamibacterales bacterium]|nr:hypothetical protein [Vicinamibacterales bacterium]
MTVCASAAALRRTFLGIALASLAAAAACAEVVADNSACRNLEYKDGSVERAKYLPCAAEMIATLEDLDRQSKAALDGDAQARAQGQAALRRLRGLVSAAGGRQLLERWPDRPLTDLNLDISNALTKYEAFYMLGPVDASSRFARESRAAATAEYEGGNRRYEEAKRLFRRLN